MITLTFGCPSAIGTGLLLRTETAVTDSKAIIWWRTAEPTRPVAPVRMRCILEGMKEVDAGLGLELENWTEMLKEKERIGTTGPVRNAK